MRGRDQRDALVIGDLTALVAWQRRLRVLGGARRLPAVEFRFPELAAEQNRCFSMLAAGYQKACGCAAGRLAMSVAAIAMIGYFVIQHRLGDLELRHIAALVGISAAAALTGKLIGLLWARLQLLALVATIHRASREAQQRMSAAFT